MSDTPHPLRLDVASMVEGLAEVLTISTAHPAAESIEALQALSVSGADAVAGLARLSAALERAAAVERIDARAELRPLHHRRRVRWAIPRSTITSAALEGLDV